MEIKIHQLFLQNRTKCQTKYIHGKTLWVLKIEGDEMITFHTGCLELQTLDIKESMKGIINHGFFGKTSPEIAKITGKTNYEVEVTSYFGTKRYAALTDNGSR